jgi:hypothetical protein
MHCAPGQAAEPLLLLLRRFATESARQEARMFRDELMAEEAIAPHDLIALPSTSFSHTRKPIRRVGDDLEKRS